MRLRNTTNIPTEIVRDVVRFVRPSGIKRFRVYVCNSRSTYGGNGGHGGVKVRIGDVKYPRFYHPYQYGQFKGRKHWVGSRVEMLVLILAHELRHTWQAKAKNKNGYAWGARGRYSEIDTEAYAIRKLREWRRRS